jgi:hypothetical protein
MVITFRLPAIIGLVLVLPFVILEFANRRNYHESFPLPLFGFLWFLAMVFFVTVLPMLRTIHTRNNILAQSVYLLMRVTVLMLIAWMWTAILTDQMPCFLGVLRCD